MLRAIFGILILISISVSARAADKKPAPPSQAAAPAKPPKLTETERADLAVAVMNVNELTARFKAIVEDLQKQSAPHEQIIQKIMAHHKVPMESIRDYDMDAMIKTGEIKKKALAQAAPTAPPPAKAEPPKK